MNYQNTLTDGTANPITEQTTQYLYNFALTELRLDTHFSEMFVKTITNLLIDGVKNDCKKQQSKPIYYGESKMDAYFKLHIEMQNYNDFTLTVEKKYDTITEFLREGKAYIDSIKTTEKSTGIPKYLN